MATRDQPRPRWKRLDAVMAPFDALSVEALARAALDSPSASHWAAATGLIWTRALTRPPHGAVAATPVHLSRLVDAAVAAWPTARDLSDWWPSDPRLIVTIRAGAGRVRLHPGRMVDPLRLVRRLERIAVAADNTVAERHGFRVTDLVEVGLRLADLQVTALAAVWPASAVPEPLLLRVAGASPFAVADEVRAMPPVVTSEEVATAARLGERDLLAAASDACEHPTAAAAACRWATAPARRARWPGCLAVATDAGSVPVPASLVLEALDVAVGRLLADIADDSRVRQRCACVAAEELWSALGLPFPEDEAEVPSGGLLRIAERHLASIDLVAEPRGASIGAAVNDAMRRAAARTTDDVAARTGTAADARAEMLRLVVIEAPGRPERLSGGRVLVVAADELTRVLSEAADGPHGQDEAWDFLLDLQRVPPSVELRPPELLDAWRHWREHGWLLPLNVGAPAVSDVAVLFGWLAHDPSWPDAARWDATERLLDAARLPPVSAHWARDLDERNAATLWAPPAMTGGRPTCYALHPNGLVIGATGDLPSAGIPDGTGSLPIVVATAVRDALLARPAAVAALHLDAAAPVALLVAVDPEEDGIAVATAEGLPPLILVGRGLLAATAVDPARTHHTLGAALAHAALLAGRPVDTRVFAAAWQAGPVALVAGVRPAPVDRSPRRKLPRTRAARVRAHQAHAVAIRATAGHLPQTQTTGSEAASLCRRLLIPAAAQALHDAIAAVDRDLLVRVAATWADEAHAHRAQLRDRLDLALAAPWRDDVLADSSGYQDDPDQTRPLQVLIETVLAADSNPNSAGTCPDRIDLAGLAEQARLLAWIGAAADGYRRGLNPLTITLLPGGVASVSITEPSARVTATVDIAAYIAAADADAFAAAAADARPQDPIDVEQLLADRDGTERPFQRLTDLPNLPRSLLALDEAMVRALGTGLDGITAVLTTCIDMPPPSIGTLPTPIPFALLQHDIAQWARLPPDQVAAAVRLLTIDTTLARMDPTDTWEVERRDARLTARPLIAVADGLLVLPHLCVTARNVLVGRLDDGRLPWPVRDNRLRLAVDAYRRHITRQLEHAVAGRLTELGLPHAMNVRENRAAAAGIAALPGEIDALAADAASATLWVIEAKHVRRAVSAGEIRDRVQKFVEPNGYVDVLLRKTAAVAAYASAAASLAGATEHRSWRVAPLMVTAAVEPAAFAAPQRVQFATLRTLPATLASGPPRSPASGDARC